MLDDIWAFIVFDCNMQDLVILTTVNRLLRSGAGQQRVGRADEPGVLRRHEEAGAALRDPARPACSAGYERIDVLLPQLVIPRSTWTGPPAHKYMRRSHPLHAAPYPLHSVPGDARAARVSTRQPSSAPLGLGTRQAAHAQPAPLRNASVDPASSSCKLSSAFEQPTSA